MVAGRPILPEDTGSTPRVAMVNEAFVQKYLGRRHPIGHRLQILSGAPHEVVGVVENAQFHSARGTPSPSVFLPLLQDAYLPYICEVQVRTTVSADRMASLMRSMIAQVDRRLEMGSVRTLRSQVVATFAPERTSAGFLVGFAVLALLVAAVGLYGTVSYGLERRMSEIGLRRAVGASSADIVWLIAKSSALRLAAGLMVGALLARVAGALLSAQLFGVAPTDAQSLLVAAAVLSVVVALATARPLVRAIRVEPTTALRVE